MRNIKNQFQGLLYSGFLACAFVLMAPSVANAMDGGFRLNNKTNTDLDFYVDGTYRCQASAWQYCTAWTDADSEHSLEARGADGRSISREGAEVGKDDIATWTITPDSD